MALVKKIDSNATGLRFAFQTDIGVEPAGPWLPLEPNSYSDFGGNFSQTRRDPINPDRQNRKGMITDLESAGGFNSDLTRDERPQQLLQSFFFAALRRKSEFGNVPDGGTGAFTAITTSQYQAASGLTIFEVGRLVFAQNAGNSTNNGLKRVTTAAAGATTVAETLVAEASPPAALKLTEVGHQAASGDINVDAAGVFPALTSTTLDFTTLGLIPGECVFVGGDAANTFFSGNAVNNGFKRVRSIAAQRLEFDKSGAPMVTETGTGKTIQIFFGRVIRNELAALITRFLVNLERTLGAPETTQPAQIQSEYVEDAVGNEFTLDLKSTDKAMFDMAFIAADYQVRSGVTGVKSGTRPPSRGFQGMNNSTDIRRFRLATVANDEAPSALLSFCEEASVSINNNATIVKALGVLGGIDVVTGNFTVEGNVTAHFTTIDAIQAIRDNADVTLDVVLVSGNAGVSIDLPLITLGEGRLNVEKDQTIKLPVSLMAATAESLQVGTALPHTMLMCFYDYLPTLASTLGGVAA
jgi:hypothetical protein